MTEQPEDDRGRPLVYQASTQAEGRRKPRSVRVLGGVGVSVALAAAAAAVVFGTTAVWSVVDPGRSHDAPAPLWVPSPVPAPAAVDDRSTSAPPTSTSDDHGGDDRGGDDRTGTASPTTSGDNRGGRTTEPGDDRGGGTTEPGDDHGGHGGGSGGGSDDGKGHG